MERSLGLKVLFPTWLFSLPQSGMPEPSLGQEQGAEIRAFLALHSIQSPRHLNTKLTGN